MRLQGFDYRHGWFFVTGCVRGRAHLFGRVINGAMVHSLAGRIAAEEWVRIAGLRSDVTLDAFVFMPDHFHAIIRVESTDKGAVPCRGPAARSLGAVIKVYKSHAARRIESETGFCGRDIWQRGFHERVIRGPWHIAACRKYIAVNPVRWGNEMGPTKGRPLRDHS